MHNKKICLVGAPRVGKTCLMQRFANGTFSYRFRNHIGVNVEQREVEIDGERVQLRLWDFQGQHEHSPTPTRFLDNAAAIVYVVDGTRVETLSRLEKIKRDTEQIIGKAIPSLLLFNKSDLSDQWQISAEMMSRVEAGGTITLLTSCKEGSGVNTAFNLLTQMAMGKVAIVAA